MQIPEIAYKITDKIATLRRCYDPKWLRKAPLIRLIYDWVADSGAQSGEEPRPAEIPTSVAVALWLLEAHCVKHW